VSDAFAPGLLQRLPFPVRKVALVRASRIGDFICATPAIRALHAALPDAQFVLIGLPFLRDLVARSPHLAGFAEFPGYPGMADQFFEPQRALQFFAAMQAEQFDLALQMNGSGVYSNPFTLMLGARATAGFVRPGDPAGRLDAALPLPETGPEIRRMLSLPAFLGAPSQGEGTEFPLWPDDHAAAEDLLAGADRPLIGIHPAAREATKRWPAGRFAALAAQLQRFHGGTLVLVGGPDERPLAEAVANDLSAPCLNLAGRTSLPVLGAVIARLAVLVTNDSGPAHVGYALGTPTVTVFGGTDPARWGPPAWSAEAPGLHQVITNPVPCWPCDYWVCPIGYQCLAGISVAEVKQAAEQVIAP
jgi:ADP-heptose:LPS heptosyltransferase